MTVLVKHDPGCRYAREIGGGHSDAAKRLSDWYNIHRAASGFGCRGVFAISLRDGTSDGVLYENRAAAIHYQRHNAQFYAYIRLMAPSMTVCEAASVMRMQRQAYELQRHHMDADAKRSLEIIPRLTIEGRDTQIVTMAALMGSGLPVALGYAKEN